MAELLVLTDMMGRGTHGLAQVGAYLDEIASGGMAGRGAPDLVRDTGATVVWDGRYLPGLWLTREALALGYERLPAHGVVTVAMRRSHHIGCLAALAKGATDRGLFVLIASSGPHTRAVAPHGGREGLFSPNPFAVGFPAGANPVLVDISASLTTVSNTRGRRAEGRRLDRPWLLDSEGRPTDDSALFEGEGRGTLMLLGGQDAGHKGFGLAVMVEALTQGLSGHGRKDGPTRWGASVFLQLIDPEAFAGREAFVEQMSFFTQACRAGAPIDPSRPVRLPGDAAARSIARCRSEGVPLTPKTAATLRSWADRLGVDAAILA